jgi:hypothetical protein
MLRSYLCRGVQRRAHRFQCGNLYDNSIGYPGIGQCSLPFLCAWFRRFKDGRLDRFQLSGDAAALQLLQIGVCLPFAAELFRYALVICIEGVCLIVPYPYAVFAPLSSSTTWKRSATPDPELRKRTVPASHPWGRTQLRVCR